MCDEQCYNGDIFFSLREGGGIYFWKKWEYENRSLECT